MPALNSPNMKRRLRVLGIFLILMELLSLLLGLGMPGVAWVVAMLLLLAQNLIARVLGPSLLWIALGISALHLLTFGPFPIAFRPVSKIAVPPLWFIVVFIVLPFFLSALTILGRRRQ